MRAVQEGATGNSLPICYACLGQGALGIDQESLKPLSGLAQGIQKALPADDYPGIFKLAGVQCGKVLLVPGRKFRTGFCNLKNSSFLWKFPTEGGQRVAKTETAEKKAGLTCTKEGKARKPAQFGSPIVSETALQLDPGGLEIELPVVLHQGQGGALGGTGFGENAGGFHWEPVQCRPGSTKFDPKLAPNLFTGTSSRDLPAGIVEQTGGLSPSTGIP